MDKGKTQEMESYYLSFLTFVYVFTTSGIPTPSVLLKP